MHRRTVGVRFVFFIFFCSIACAPLLSSLRLFFLYVNSGMGADFLGWNFRKYSEKLIIKPSKKAVKAIVSNLSDTILRRGKAWEQDVLIMKLN